MLADTQLGSGEVVAAPSLQTPTQAWASIQSSLRDTYGNDVFDAFFAKLLFGGIERGQVSISAPTSFIVQYVTSHYGHEILELWRVARFDVDGLRIYSRQFRVPTTKEKARPPGRGEPSGHDEQSAPAGNSAKQEDIITESASSDDCGDVDTVLARISQSPVPLQVYDIQRLVCAYYGVSFRDMVSSRRRQNLITPRHVAMYLSRKLTSRSLWYIGRAFGNRHHTTILDAGRKVAALIESGDECADDINALTEMLAD